MFRERFVLLIVLNVKVRWHCLERSRNMGL